MYSAHKLYKGRYITMKDLSNELWSEIRRDSLYRDIIIESFNEEEILVYRMDEIDDYFYNRSASYIIQKAGDIDLSCDYFTDNSGYIEAIDDIAVFLDDYVDDYYMYIIASNILKDSETIKYMSLSSDILELAGFVYDDYNESMNNYKLG